ncbi:MAG: hemolysin [Bacteroidetes bacterium CG18_big_fil_WC_8_21_14_2_50_41_14]|nr:MAG: hemolysin [Bacteroidetes bacterium CG18_big_fil_WC_8_21_14_2_50_41_14]
MSTDGIIIISMLILSGFFSGMEIAFVSSNKLKQELDLKRKLLPAAILSAFYNNPSRFIGSLLLGNNIALVVYGISTARVLEPIIVSHLPEGYSSGYLVLLIQTILSTLLILIVAEFIPKVLFRINPNANLKFFAIPIWLFYYLFYPLIVVYIGISELLLRKVLRVQLADEPYIFTSIDLEEYVRDYTPENEQPEELNQEMVMIQNAIDFKHVKLRECMVPRPEIEALEIGESVEVLRNYLTETGHSKIMIFEKTIDLIVGYVHAYDMFSNPTTIRQIVRPVNLVTETMSARDMLQSFIKNHKSVAVVVDEFGGTSGIVTMEDVIEEIFGDIEDEYDIEEETEIKLTDNSYIFSARLEVEYLNEKYKLSIPLNDEYETLAGFIIYQHQSIPVLNEKIHVSPYLFTILKGSGSRLDEVKIEIDE